jgi:hypothetical protein
MTIGSFIRRAARVGLALVTSVAGAQSTSADTLRPCRDGEARAQVMFVGTFHFANPGRDVIKTKHVPDMLAPDRQREIAEVVQRLAAFRPTRVAVEFDRTRQGRLDSLYREYRAGRFVLPVNEVFQLGFRVAAASDLGRVDAVDTERSAARIEDAQRSEGALVAARAADPWSIRLQQASALQDVPITPANYRTLREMLLDINASDAIARSHAAYFVGYFKGGGDSTYAGPDFIAGWYERNLRIFRNLQRITRGPDERILVIYGSGHLATMQQFVQGSPEYELVPFASWVTRR